MGKSTHDQQVQMASITNAICKRKSTINKKPKRWYYQQNSGHMVMTQKQ
jgi:hypothetical protein